MSTLNGPILSRFSIALTFPAMSDFQRTVIRERWNEGWDERCRSSRVDKNEETKTGKRKAGEGRRQETILKKLCAALLRSFRGWHGEKNGLCEGGCPG